MSILYVKKITVFGITSEFRKCDVNRKIDGVTIALVEKQF